MVNFYQSSPEALFRHLMNCRIFVNGKGRNCRIGKLIAKATIDPYDPRHVALRQCGFSIIEEHGHEWLVIANYCATINDLLQETCWQGGKYITLLKRLNCESTVDNEEFYFSGWSWPATRFLMKSLPFSRKTVTLPGAA